MEEEKGVIAVAASPPKLAVASGFGDIAGFTTVSNFYMPEGVDGVARKYGVFPDKLIIPREYHAVIDMCYDFYQRGGIVGTVVNRLTEMAMTPISNGQRKTTDEANEYFDTVLHRPPSRINRFIHTAALEYFLSGMVLPRVEWKEMLGEELSPRLIAKRKYWIPIVDLYPPRLIRVDWGSGWGTKKYFLRIPDKDVKLIRGGADKIKSQQNKSRYEMWEKEYPDVFQAVKRGSKEIEITDVDAILRKEVSFSEYPTPFLFNVLESLVYKQQLRRMDYSTASRIIHAILLITEGNDDFPLTEESRGNLDALKSQISFYMRNPSMMQRLFPLFSNHTTKLEWIQPDVQSMLDQSKYEQVNDEISEGLGFAKILVTGESRNAQASEVSTWAIQPMMEELRDMLLEWLAPIYEQASELNGFRQTPIPTFAPIRLQDFIKTAAVFAQAFKEGNISRTTRNQMMGIDFVSETEKMKDEKQYLDEIEALGDYPILPYDVQTPPPVDLTGTVGGGTGRPPGAKNKGGRPLGTQNPAVNKRNRGIKPSGQAPVSRLKTKAETEVLDPEELIEFASEVMASLGKTITVEDL